MVRTAIIAKGVAHGKIIELEHDSGLPEGQMVSVVLRPANSGGAGLRAAFGGWAEDAHQLDRFIEDIYRDREDDRPEPG